MRCRSTLAVVVGAAALWGAACSTDDTSSTIDVFAAASLTSAFTAIGDQFMAANPGTEISFNFAASSELAAQIVEGAPADVFAAADLSSMERLVDNGDVVVEPRVFATNRAAIIVGAGNPKGIDSVDDLTDEDLVVVQCAPEVPCGAYTNLVHANAGVTVVPDSFERNVKAVVAKVTLGEADAGIVYVTDVMAAGDDAEGVEIPADINVTADYPIAGVGRSDDDAISFIEFVLGEQGRLILADHGFGAP